MDLKRGDIIICALSGNYGKARPAIIIQSDLFNETHSSITICPITTHLVEAPLFRLMISPAHENGLKQKSQIMIDKMTTLRRDKIRQKIGSISGERIEALDEATQIWLGLK